MTINVPVVFSKCPVHWGLYKYITRPTLQLRLENSYNFIFFLFRNRFEYYVLCCAAYFSRVVNCYFFEKQMDVRYLFVCVYILYTYCEHSVCLRRSVLLGLHHMGYNYIVVFKSLAPVVFRHTIIILLTSSVNISLDRGYLSRLQYNDH